MTDSNRLQHFIHLTRLHKPVGAILLLWPALWGLWLAAGGIPDLKLLVIFIAGAFVTRAAGCAINDFADRHIDGHVARTHYRPVAAGHIKPREAVATFVVLSLLAFGLVLLTNPLTVKLACIGVVIIAIYPFMKRYTHLPQVVLGLAWSWSLPMAFAAQTQTVPLTLLPLMLAVILWTVIFDTYYAIVDREDDLKLGVKSAAILFGRHDRLIIAVLQVITIGLLLFTGSLFGLGRWYYLGVAVVTVLLAHQQYKTRHGGRDAAFAAFMDNRWVGVVLFVAIALNYGIP